MAVNTLKRGPTIDLQWGGDIAAAVASLSPYGGTIRLEYGLYALTAPLVIPEYVSIESIAGVPQSVNIDVSGVVGNPAISVSGAGVSRLRNLYFSGGGTYANTIIGVVGSSNFRCEGCVFADYVKAAIAISGGTSRYNTIADCVFEGGSADGSVAAIDISASAFSAEILRNSFRSLDSAFALLATYPVTNSCDLVVRGNHIDGIQTGFYGGFAFNFAAAPAVQNLLCCDNVVNAEGGAPTSTGILIDAAGNSKAGVVCANNSVRNMTGVGAVGILTQNVPAGGPPVLVSNNISFNNTANYSLDVDTTTSGNA